MIDLALAIALLALAIVATGEGIAKVIAAKNENIEIEDNEAGKIMLGVLVLAIIFTLLYRAWT